MRSNSDSIQGVLDELMAHLRPPSVTSRLGQFELRQSRRSPNPPEAACLIEIEATIEDVWPSFGLAYARDDSGRVWGITKSTPSRNASIASLFKGDPVRLWVTARGRSDAVLVDLYERLSAQ